MDIIQCNDKYIETQQDTIVLIIKNVSKKNIDNNRWNLKISEFIIFGTCDKIRQLNKIYLNSTNLKNYGFKVIVGNVVWNHVINIDYDSSKTTLIYSSDIKTNKFKMVNSQKILKRKTGLKKGELKPLLLVNRGIWCW